ncbi:MAG: hypothetical protein HY282_06050 [Nitrospirae bacterium]|nr:hypothetical protein [Candidatus Manganitrophaceae bacterium]
MLSGINTDIQFKGEVYHIQTEDGGATNPVITTLLFKGGAICSSKKTSYADILESPSFQEVVRELMKEQHKGMVRDLAAGKFESAPPRPKEAPSAEKTETGPTPKSKNASPSPQSPNQKKTLDDLILDYLSEKEENTD